jgi:hypothetical protein
MLSINLVLPGFKGGCKVNGSEKRKLQMETEIAGFLLLLVNS